MSGLSGPLLAPLVLSRALVVPFGVVNNGRVGGLWPRARAGSDTSLLHQITRAGSGTLYARVQAWPAHIQGNSPKCAVARISIGDSENLNPQ